MTSLDILLRPRSVAMIGASGDVTRIGGRALRHLKEVGFAGDIFPVNPGRDEVQGLKAYAGVDDIPGRIDCAVLALPTGAVLPAIEACARKGVGGAVIFSAGFAEMGEQGVLLQQRMVDIANAAGMRLLGPNCLGMYNLHAKSFLSFSGIFDDVKGTAGRLGLVSQSGGYAGEVVKSAQEVGLNFGVWITTGNEADVGLGEAMHHMAMSDDVDVVVGYIEGVRDRQSFFDGLAAAHARRKPVVVLKVGRTEQGAKAAASHTASLAGSDVVYDAVFERYGVYRARTTEEMLDVAYAASRGHFPRGRRLAILTNSGGIGVQAADFAADEGLAVPTASAAVQTRLIEISPNGAPFNPIDLTGQVANDPPMYARAIDVVLESAEFDCAYVNVGLIAGLPFIKRPLLDSLKAVAKRFADVPMAASVTADAETLAEYGEAGFLCYREPARAIKTLAALASFPLAWDRDLPDASDLTGLPTLERGTALSEAASKAMLAGIGIPSPAEHLVQDPADAEAAAMSIGCNVAIKVVSPDILHKTEIGGVALGIDPKDAAATLEAMVGKVTASMPDARIEGYLVSPMITGGTECIVGVHTDPLLGPVIMFGLGGVTVELLKDVTMRLAPVTEDQAMDMIRSVRSFPLLDGFRGRAKADVVALAQAISALSRLAAANAETVRTIEVNPLLVLDKGNGILALDAVIET
ncbi:acetate--CoA ligase family protein [Novosphingobium cyanobacteriorum]|uniref:Acetate--CoA ligase family protein n=1 Tax=Novosphingobium cyanobacteriorum TaxID=3024215 RepID=A0ABT6CKX0_9SPHN|nr:acetate--CoA ligase family protein [Novosphingobium cyanobacteriorum]MDF8334573.1 acetate--CoA ligase family protein [Novosphingobium cyanobacteriorum]